MSDSNVYSYRRILSYICTGLTGDTIAHAQALEVLPLSSPSELCFNQSEAFVPVMQAGLSFVVFIGDADSINLVYSFSSSFPSFLSSLLSRFLGTLRFAKLIIVMKKMASSSLSLGLCIFATFYSAI